MDLILKSIINFHLMMSAFVMLIILLFYDTATTGLSDQCTVFKVIILSTIQVSLEQPM